EEAVEIITQIHKSAIAVPQEGEEARIYILIDRQDQPLLADQFLAWQQACPRWQLLLGEPLAPYHFI
ncbi:gas vesicle protein, partial [Planktothrix sp. FACHB-1355]|nr:gas vesicle protein [Planktothrix sp. FACHB-1355]